MKKLLLTVTAALLLNAQVLDRVVGTVNNMPITSYDIDKLSQQLNIPKEKAFQILVEQSLIKSEIKKHGINIDDFEIENAMEKIAKQNGLSLFEFKNILMQKGEYNQVREKIKEDLLKQKLFDQIVQTKLHISENEIKNYYENHKDDFKVFNTIQVTKYSANNKKLLNDVKQNPLMTSANVKVSNTVYGYNELPVGLLFLFKQTKVGDFTPIINDGLGYSMYYIARKDGNAYMPFEKVKNAIANKLAAEKREIILKDYFGKLKNRAYIKTYNN